ncbi:ABC transporter permease [Altererythrobacter aquiaggeris]|uniref:ABC transporter permease n=1 Tax=Aestuarierythrobacter aquiaggeris TaxID=1898396 RepID=UPI003018B16F
MTALANWLGGFWAMAAKELKIVLLDKRARTTLIISPIIQLMLYGMASTLEVRNFDIGVVNRDNGVAAQEVLSGLAGSPNVRKLIYYPSMDAMADGIARREVIAGLSLPPDLSRDVAAGRTGSAGLLVDGRKINAGQIVAGYIQTIIHRAGAELAPDATRAGPELVAVNWYNPNLDYRWFTMPAMIAIITSVLVISISVHTFAREREFGTIDTLQVLPLGVSQKLLGKIVPAFLVGLGNALFYVLVIPLFFGVPLIGSLALLFGAVLCFSLAMAGLGVAISSFARTQQQAFLVGFMALTPMTLLAGYATPVDNMPEWLQWLAWINPLRHMLEISQGVFVKDISLVHAADNIAMMLAFAAVSVGTAYTILKTRLD